MIAAARDEKPFPGPAACIAHDGSPRLRKCGTPALPGLAVCAEHFDQHEGLARRRFVDFWFRRHGWHGHRVKD